VLQVRNIVPVFAEYHRIHYPQFAVIASDGISMKKSQIFPIFWKKFIRDSVEEI
jgi:hypothetical protein